MDSAKLRFYRVYAPSLLRFKMHPREIKLEGDTPNPEFGWIPFNHFFTRGSFLPFFLYSRLTLNLVHKFRNMIVFRSRNFTYKSLTPPLSLPRFYRLLESTTTTRTLDPFRKYQTAHQLIRCAYG